MTIIKKRFLSMLTAIIMIVGLGGVIPTVSAGADEITNTKIYSGGVPTILVQGTADSAVSGTTKIRITFDCAPDVAYNMFADMIELEVNIEGTKINKKYRGEDEGTTGEKNISIECEFGSQIKTGNNVTISALTYSWITAKDYVWAIQKLEYLDAKGKVLKSIQATTQETTNPSYSTGKVITSGDFEYEVFNDGTVEITHYMGDETEVTVPSKIDGKKVKGIGSLAFVNESEGDRGLPILTGNKTIKKVIISEGIEYIGMSAFQDATSLTHINIPESIKTIGFQAFVNTGYYNLDSNWDGKALYIGNNLIDVNLGFWDEEEYEVRAGTRVIADFAFSRCSYLDSLIIPTSITNIGESAFEYCSKLKDIYYLGSKEQWSNIDIKSYGNDYLLNATVHYNFDISEPDNLSDFGYEVFDNGVVITSYKGSETELIIPSWIDKKRVVGIDTGAFENCSNIISVYIPDTVSSIGHWAFEFCSNLKSVTLSSKVKTIYKSAFEGCKSLTDVYYSGTKEEWNSIDIGYYNEPLLNATIHYNGTGPDITTEPTDPEPIISGDYEYRVLEDGTVEITDYTGDATEVNIPSEIDGKSVTSIGYSAFEGCISLINLTIPDSITTIASHAFWNCDNLEIVNIPNSVTYIGSLAFASCNNLKSVRIPENVKEIPYATFDSCSSLSEIIIPNGVETISQWAFLNCSNLKSVTFSDSVKTILVEAFLGCSSLTSITIPRNIEQIGPNAFGYIGDDRVKLDDFKIYCYSGTAGEQYAIDNGFDYILLDGEQSLGDLSYDGKITTVDVGIINSFAKGTKEYTDEQLKLADANSDGKITTVDVGLINKIAKGV